MPKISIIVPIYKVEQYLNECIDSILTQTFTDFELILVDDGSPDGCGAICDEYMAKDNRITVIHKPNGGLSDARNAGLEIVSGEYISFVDSDDLVSDNYLEVLYTTLISTGADISQCKMVLFDDNTEPVIDKNALESRTLSGRSACVEYYKITHNIGVSACGKLYKLRLFKDIRFPKGMICEDQATTPIVLYSSNGVSTVYSTAYFYRTRSYSIMHSNFTRKIFDDILAVRRCKYFFSNMNDNELVCLADNFEKIINAKLIIRAHLEKAKDEIPKEFYMSLPKAFKTIRENSNSDYFEYQLAAYNPKLAYLYARTRKLRQILGLPCRK